MSRIHRRPLLVGASIALPATALAFAGCREETPRPADRNEPSRSGDEREVRLVVPAVATSDGAGVKLRRALGSRALSMLDPFLLLDEMRSDRPEDYAAGFPTHPHRGFETVTYVIEGAADHEDSLGNHGHLAAGSAQWMTAARGIVHSEMPTHDETSDRLWALQLWVNLPAAQKLGKPRYQDIVPGRIPEIRLDDAAVRLVAGTANGITGPVEGIATSPEMVDVTIAPKGTFSHPVERAHNAFVYMLDGIAAFGTQRKMLRQGEIGVLGPGTLATMRSESGGRLLFFAAQPIGEPVARSGPFVMNTDDELRKAWDDYRTGQLASG
jgi:redox-sensitive bicupin YhaK (pirin superfamily)